MNHWRPGLSECPQLFVAGPHTGYEAPAHAVEPVAAGTQTWDTLKITPQSRFSNIAQCAVDSTAHDAEPERYRSPRAQMAQAIAAAFLPVYARGETPRLRSKNIKLVMHAIAKIAKDEAVARSPLGQDRRAELPDGTARLFAATHEIMKFTGAGNLHVNATVAGFDACGAIRSTKANNIDPVLDTLSAHLEALTNRGARLQSYEIRMCAAGLQNTADGALIAKVTDVLARHMRPLSVGMPMRAGDITEALAGIHLAERTSDITQFLHEAAIHIDLNAASGRLFRFQHICRALSGFRRQDGGGAADAVLHALSMHLLRPGSRESAFHPREFVSAIDGIAGLRRSEAVEKIIAQLTSRLSAEAAAGRYIAPGFIMDALYALRKAEDTPVIRRLIGALSAHADMTMSEALPLAEKSVAKALSGLRGKASDNSDFGIHMMILRLTKRLSSAGKAGRFLESYDSIRAARGIVGRKSADTVDAAIRTITGHVLSRAQQTGVGDPDALRAVVDIAHSASPKTLRELAPILSAYMARNGASTEQRSRLS